LKSVDVVDRFITNGGKAYTIAAMINEFRRLPGVGDTTFRPNSAQIMMSYNMRRAGYQDWTVGTHAEFSRPNPLRKENDLDVRGFRAPRETHPKSAPSGQISEDLQHNAEPNPVELKALVLHVKVHPSGYDALDLTRCIHYAIAHPDEIWYFPDDFTVLVNKLGGPTTVTHSHLDRQVFNRRENYFFPSPAKSTPNSKYKRTPNSKNTSSAKVMPQSHKFSGGSATPSLGSPLKRMITAETTQISGRRKSDRLANKVTVSLREVGSDEVLDGPVFGILKTNY
jgi:hypothetical protein